jgi:class 3 adenylate cyclase
MVRAAIEINRFMPDRIAKVGNRTFEVRIGLHSGNVVAGIVGVTKFAYDIWGDTVSTAARIEQNSEAGKINISQTTYELVKGTFTCTYRGEIEAKNKGQLKMYYVS